MWKFMNHVNSKYGLNLNDYPALYKWSVDNVGDFWAEVWHFAGIKAAKDFDEVWLRCVMPPLKSNPLFADPKQ